MIVRVAKTTGNYTVVDNRPAQDDRLSAAATGFLFYLLTKPDDWCVLVDDLRARFSMGRDATRNTLRELESAGYASLVTSRDSSGKVSGREWLIQEIPSTEPNDRKPDFQAVGHRSPENTESLKNRRSVFSGHILSTDRVLNTDVVQNTDVTERSGGLQTELFEAETVAGDPLAAGPAKRKRAVKDETAFDESFGGPDGLERFSASFSGTDYAFANLHYYYEAVRNWANGKGVKRKDWIATARTFMLRDSADGKLRTNQQPTNDKATPTTRQSTTRTGINIQQSRRVAEAAAAKYRK